jgi:hypothetical protein
MKNFLSVFILILGAVRLSAQAPVAAADPNAPAITFDVADNTIDFGNVAQYSDAVRTFTFTNTGKTDLVITSIKGQCGCTTILPDSWSKEPIPPGGKGSFKVKYDTSVRIGNFDKQIMIYSNAPMATVKIKGVVTAAPGN